MTEPISNRERLERDEEERVEKAARSTIPGMVTHLWNSTFFSEAIRQANEKRKIR